MGKRKKRLPSTAAGREQKPLAPALDKPRIIPDPPRKHPGLLIAAACGFVFWNLFLATVAINRW